MSKIALALSLSALTLGGCATSEAYAGTGMYKTSDGSPMLGDGRYLGELGAAYTADYKRIRGSVAYFMFNTNSEFPPYETFGGDQFPRAGGDIGKTFDRHLFNFDWDDPYSSSRYGR